MIRASDGESWWGARLCKKAKRDRMKNQRTGQARNGECIAGGTVEPRMFTRQGRRYGTACLAKRGAAVMRAARRRSPIAFSKANAARRADDETGDAASACHRTLSEGSSKTLHDEEIGQKTGNQASRKAILQHVTHRLHGSFVTHFDKSVTATNAAAGPQWAETAHCGIGCS